jgi:hypothetical protein
MTDQTWGGGGCWGPDSLRQTGRGYFYHGAEIDNHAFCVVGNTANTSMMATFPVARKTPLKIPRKTPAHMTETFLAP